MIKPFKAKTSPIISRIEIQDLLSQARALVNSDKLGQAISVYRLVLEQDPRCLEALHVCGSLEFHFQNYANAYSLLLNAVAIHPKNFQLQLLMGKCAKNLKRYQEAESFLKQSILIDPKSVEAFVETGLLYFLNGELNTAIEYFEGALKIDPNSYDAWTNLGVVLKEMGNFYDAHKKYSHAILLDSNNPNAFANRGVLLHVLGQFEDALVDLDRAIELSPNLATSHVSRGQLLLTLGAYELGWNEFEWRWQYLRENQLNTSRYHDYPLWSGRESLVGKTILLYAEQGLGDSLQFSRYVSLVAQLGGKVIFECEPPLYELFKSLEGVAHLIMQGEIVPSFDFQCPLMSLPRVFRTTLDSIPVNGPYLYADPIKIEGWRMRLGPKSRPRVGLVWSGGFRPGQPELWSVNKRRNLPLISLKSLSNMPIDFISLQKGAQAEAELKKLVEDNWEGPIIANHVNDLNDFSDTAALIANLDLVISVDTSTAHLCAALGRPTWILNRYDTCWRWLLERADSPWYPSVKLYRQQALGQWDYVIEQIKADLWQLYCK